MRNSRVNFRIKIQIRCWDINKTRQGITFICRTLYNNVDLSLAQDWVCLKGSSVCILRNEHANIFSFLKHNMTRQQ